MDPKHLDRVIRRGHLRAVPKVDGACVINAALELLRSADPDLGLPSGRGIRDLRMEAVVARWLRLVAHDLKRKRLGLTDGVARRLSRIAPDEET